MQADIVVTFVSADKDFAFQLISALQSMGISTEERLLRLGDSLHYKVRDGLRTARYAVLILSREFFKKPWPRGDLDQLAAIDRDFAGETKLLPIWHNIGPQDISFYSPSLAEKIGVESKYGLDTVVSEIREVVISTNSSSQASPPSTTETTAPPVIGAKSVDLARLVDGMNRYFSLEEIETLAFVLGIDFDNLGGGSKGSKTRELVMFMDRRGRLEELINRLRRERPHVTW
jgi:hypothetical protein